WATVLGTVAPLSRRWFGPYFVYGVCGHTGGQRVVSDGGRGVEPGRGQQAVEIGRRRGFDPHRPQRRWMDEGDAPRVQSLTWKGLQCGGKQRIRNLGPPRRAVKRVADERPVFGRPVNPDLMFAAGQQVASQKRQANRARRRTSDGFESRDAGPAALLHDSD